MFHKHRRDISCVQLLSPYLSLKSIDTQIAILLRNSQKPLSFIDSYLFNLKLHGRVNCYFLFEASFLAR